MVAQPVLPETYAEMRMHIDARRRHIYEGPDDATANAIAAGQMHLDSTSADVYRDIYDL